MAEIKDKAAEENEELSRELPEENELSETPDTEAVGAPDDADDVAEDTENVGSREVPPADEVDYAAMAERDLIALKREFRELQSAETLYEIDNLERYGELRELGLSPREAYLATRKRHYGYDNRQHLSSSVPRHASGPRSAMTSRELDAARELFSSLGDAELQSLYKRVSR